MFLGDIAQIKVGLVVSRKKAEVDLEAKVEYPMLTLKNIQIDGVFTAEPIETFKSTEELEEGFFTREGNILFRLSHPYTAVLIDKEHAGLLIPSYFANIEIVDPRFLSGYVVWYLNTDKVKGELLKRQRGTFIPSTNKKILERIEIPELDMAKQRIIAEIQHLYQKEKRLYQQLIIEKEKFHKALTHKLIKMMER